MYSKLQNWLYMAVELAKLRPCLPFLKANKKNVKQPRILDISTGEADENCQKCVGEGKG